MKQRISSDKAPAYWVLALALLFTFIPLLFIIYGGMKATGGVFSYPVDDTYIHMEIARNLAYHGNWGINPGEFNSASSSLLYTVLLALLFLVFSYHMLVPLLINAVAIILLIIYIWRWLTREGIQPLAQLVIFLAVIFFTPFPVIMLSGMEHSLQCLFAFIFLTRFAEWATAKSPSRIPLWVMVSGFLLVATRYEGLFLIAPAFLFLLWKKRPAAGFLLSFVSLLPILVFGMISIMKGSYFLPNSVLVKSEALQFTPSTFLRSLNYILIEKFTFAGAGITLLATQRLLILLPLSMILFRRNLRSYPSYTVIIGMLTIAVFLQLALADTGKFYRYEAYLVLPSIIMFSLLIISFGKELWQQYNGWIKIAGSFIILFIFFPILLRSMAGFTKAGRAMVNIYEQQYQMGMFLKNYYDDASVAANDIGAISYFRNGNIVDLWGLGTLEIAKSKKGNYWTPGFLDSISRDKNASLAIIYDSWIGNSIPGTWQKIATWQIQNNVVCGDDIVSFYAVDLQEAGELRANLEKFQNQLPATVEVVYY
jgi:hypothetical protein